MVEWADQPHWSVCLSVRGERKEDRKEKEGGEASCLRDLKKKTFHFVFMIQTLNFGHKDSILTVLAKVSAGAWFTSIISLTYEARTTYQTSTACMCVWKRKHQLLPRIAVTEVMNEGMIWKWFDQHFGIWMNILYSFHIIWGSQLGCWLKRISCTILVQKRSNEYLLDRIIVWWGFFFLV